MSKIFLTLSFLFSLPVVANEILIGPKALTLDFVAYITADKITIDGPIDTKGNELSLMAREIILTPNASIVGTPDNVKIFAGRLIGDWTKIPAKIHYGEYFVKANNKLIVGKFEGDPNKQASFTAVDAAFKKSLVVTSETNQVKALLWSLRQVNSSLEKKDFETLLKRVVSAKARQKPAEKIAPLFTEAEMLLNALANGANNFKSIEALTEQVKAEYRSSLEKMIKAIQSTFTEIAKSKDHPDLLSINAFSIYGCDTIYYLEHDQGPGMADDFTAQSTIKLRTMYADKHVNDSIKVIKD